MLQPFHLYPQTPRSSLPLSSYVKIYLSNIYLEAFINVEKILLSLVVFYQRFISPLTPPTCRFYPTCSQYTREAIEYHGALKGLYLGVRRILKCHPLHKGGFDPVPLKR